MCACPLSAIARTPRVYGQIVRIGLPSFCRQGLASYATMQLNVAAAVYGDAAVRRHEHRRARVQLHVQRGCWASGRGSSPCAASTTARRAFGRVRSAMLFTSALGGVSMLGRGRGVLRLRPGR